MKRKLLHKHQHKQEKDNAEKNIVVSRKQFKQMILPPVGTEINLEELKFHIVAHNTGKMRFTAHSKEMPKNDSMFSWEGKKYLINYLMPEKNRFSATFAGFMEAEVVTEPIPDAPVGNIEETVEKVL